MIQIFKDQAIKRSSYSAIQQFRYSGDLLTLLDPGYFFLVRSGGVGEIPPPLNISPRTTFEVGLKYYPRMVLKRAQDPKDEVYIFKTEGMAAV